MTISFLQVDESYPDEICGICRDSLTEDVWAHEIHRFHGRCLSDWLKIEPTCPSCKKTVDTTTLVGEDILQKQLDRRYEANKARKRRWKLQKVEFLCGLGATGCWAAVNFSERHRKYSDELTIAACFFVGVFILIKGYLQFFDRGAQ